MESEASDKEPAASDSEKPDKAKPGRKAAAAKAPKSKAKGKQGARTYTALAIRAFIAKEESDHEGEASDKNDAAGETFVVKAKPGRKAAAPKAPKSKAKRKQKRS